MITFTATGRHATARTDEAITTGSVGIPVEVALNEDFDGLQAILVFKCGDDSVDVALLGQDVTVPPQLVTTRSKMLTMGVYATREDGTIVIPTVWVEVGIVREGTQPSGVDPAEPTPSWAAQVQQWASDAAESAETATETAAGIRSDMDEFNAESAEVLADARAATVAASAGATVANQTAADLRAAAERGDFDGADGRQGDPGPQGIQGRDGPQGPKGDAYEITSADYAEIAGIVEGTIQPTIDAATDATEAATEAITAAAQAASTANDAAERAEDAIEAIGDISELAVPLMSADVRGGAKLGEGLAVVDGALTLSTEANESTGEVRGSIASLTAKGWAEQTVTDDPPSPSPDYPSEIRVARGRNLVSEEMLNANENEYRNGEGVLASNVNMRRSYAIPVEIGQTYTLHGISGANLFKMAHGLDSSGTWVELLAKTSTSVAVNTSYTLTFTIPEGVASVELSVAKLDTQVQLELGSNPMPYVPYGYVGVEVQSKNLWVADLSMWRKPVNYTICDVKLEQGKTYTVGLRLRDGKNPQPVANSTDTVLGVFKYGTSASNSVTVGRVWERYASNPKKDITFTVDETYTAPKLFLWDAARGGLVLDSYEGVLVEGDHIPESRPHWFATRTIPVPLPSKGYASSLPDGTSDMLTIDGAGKWEWKNATAEAVVNAFVGYATDNDTRQAARANGASGAVNANGSQIISSFKHSTGAWNYGVVGEGNVAPNASIFVFSPHRFASLAEANVWVAENPITVLYKLTASAITTESGYTESPMPSIPSEATITCPELDDLGVTYLVGDDVRAMAEQWYARAQSEYEQRLAALEQAVSEIIAG